MPLVFPFLKLIFPLVKDHIRLVREEIMEFVGRTIFVRHSLTMS
jgi:hypothetical protein